MIHTTLIVSKYFQILSCAFSRQIPRVFEYQKISIFIQAQIFHIRSLLAAMVIRLYSFFQITSPTIQLV